MENIMEKDLSLYKDYKYKLSYQDPYYYIDIIQKNNTTRIKFRNSYVYDDLILIESRIGRTVHAIKKYNLSYTINQILNYKPIYSNLEIFNIDNHDILYGNFDIIDNIEYTIIEAKNVTNAVKLGFLIPYNSNIVINSPRRIYIENSTYRTKDILEQASSIFKDINYKISNIGNGICIEYQFDDNQFDQAEIIFDNIKNAIERYCMGNIYEYNRYNSKI